MDGFVVGWDMSSFLRAFIGFFVARASFVESNVPRISDTDDKEFPGSC